MESSKMPLNSWKYTNGCEDQIHFKKCQYIIQGVPKNMRHAYFFTLYVCKLGAPRRLEDSIKFNKIQLASIFTCLVYLNDLSFFLKRLLKVTKSSSDSRVFWDSLYPIFLLLTYLKPTKDSILATTYSPQIKLKIRWLNCLNSVIELL